MIINLSKIDFGGVATGGKSKPEEVFDVQPTTSDQTITPTAGSVFSRGTVRAVTKEIDVNIVSDNIKEGVTILGVAGTLKEEKPEEVFDVQPTTTDQTITPTEGSVFSGGTVHAVTSAIDSNIQPGNIKEGVSILGVAGTLSEGVTPAGTIEINLNGTYDVTNYASAEVNVGDTPDYRYMKGTIDKAGLKAIGWTDEDILTYEQNKTPHYTWQNDQYKVSDENKALYLLDDPNPSSYKNNPNITFVPKKNMESYFAKISSFQNMKYIKGIPFYDTSSIRNLQFLFSDCSSLSTIPLINTVNATSAYGMFSGCSSLSTIPQLSTSNVTNANYMFRNCFSLSTIPSLDFSKVTSADGMFEGCSSLSVLPSLDFSGVTNAEYMFEGCSSLNTIPSLDFSKVKYAYRMFEGCSSLSTLPSLDFSSVTNAGSIFYECSSLSTIPSLDFSGASTTEYMFGKCKNLTSISQLVISSTTNVVNMFYECEKLTTLPQLNTANVNQMGSFLSGCKSLTTVEGIDFSGLTSSLSYLFGYSLRDVPTLTRFIVNGKINISISDNNSIKAMSAIDYESVKSILAAADRTDNTNAKTLAFNRTMTDQNGELAALVSSCSTKGWTITGLTLQ